MRGVEGEREVAGTPTPRKRMGGVPFGLSEGTGGGGGDETPKRRVQLDHEEKKGEVEGEGVGVKRNGAGKKGSFWEFLYG